MGLKLTLDYSSSILEGCARGTPFLLEGWLGREVNAEKVHLQL